MGINITYKFDLAMTEKRKDLYKLMHRSINLRESSLMNFVASSLPKFVDVQKNSFDQNVIDEAR